MPLPKIDVPTFEVVLPSNNKKLKFRPFLVKEEKILLMAAESKNMEEICLTLNQIIKNCALDDLNVEMLPSFDAEYIFLKLRERSIGEKIQVSVLDTEVEKRFETEIDLSKINVKKTNSHTTKIKLSDSLAVEMKYPTLHTILTIDTNKTNAENGIDVMIKCIDKIYDSDSVYDAKDYSEKELTEFIENLSQSMFNKLNKFFETMPSLFYEGEAVSPYTQNTVKLRLENFIDFFV